ncbi:FRIGIDA-like protein 4a isoform X1 [Telopea speciosissima]|uniref:FRIGIDA-like protein 4a isoform X1 n=1 Tax=Telopea speciosissima TaxID=54955 RepID=UPI001CC7EDC2|nr:FRIGIDA-like protein 4a isoform X1 [Telopea speciosissima]
MGSVAITDPGEMFQTSFEDFQRQTSLMTSCTLLWKELSDHFSSLEQDLQKKSEALKKKIENLDHKTKESLDVLEKREVSIDGNVEQALVVVEELKEAALKAFQNRGEEEFDDSEEGMLLKLRSFCSEMDSEGFWKFVTAKKKELDKLRAQIPLALSDCIDPPKFVMEAISEVFPVDKRVEKSEQSNDLGWACVLLLESLIPVVADPIFGNSRPLLPPRVKERAKEIAEAWKESLDQRGGIENVKTPDVHTFLQHLVTFAVVSKRDAELYRKLVIGSAWRKQMPKLAVSLGLGDKMAEMIKELINKGQQVDAVHFTYEVGLTDKFPPVPLLKAYLKDSRKAANSILEDRNNSGRAAQLAGRKEQSALRAVIKCIEEYKLEAEFPPEGLRKRLEQLEKSKAEKKRPAAVPANKRTRASNGGPMPPAKAGRLTNAYVSSFPAPAGPTFVRSPSHVQYPAGVPSYSYDRPAPPALYGNRSPPAVRDPYAYSPEEAAPPAIAGPYPGAPVNYPAYGVYGNGMAPGYQQVYYR